MLADEYDDDLFRPGRCFYARSNPFSRDELLLLDAPWIWIILEMFYDPEGRPYSVSCLRLINGSTLVEPPVAVTYYRSLRHLAWIGGS